MTTLITSEILSAIKAEFTNTMTDAIISRSEVELYTKYSPEVITALIEQGILYTGGTMCYNQMETTINNWKYCRRIYCNFQKLASFEVELKKQARKNLLSWIVTTANKLRSTLKSMSLALHTAWTRAKILLSGFVQFVKIADVDSSEEIPVFSRRVASLESQGFTPKGESKPNGLLKFIDLDKKDLGLPIASCIISMHVWQVVGWSSFS